VTAPISDSDQAFIARRSWRRVAQCDPSLPGDLVETLWIDPASLVARGEVLQHKGVRCTVRLTWNDQPYVLKHYVEPTRRHALKQLVQSSRARRTWDFSHRIADLGIATPRPVACVENRWGQLRRDSYLMYPYVEGRTLRSYFAVEARQSPEVSNKLWQQINELWQRLVELCVSLEDTNLGNFIICEAGRLWLIDLDKSRFYRNRRAAARHQARAWKQLLHSVDVTTSK
jgi:hypothetical protein